MTDTPDTITREEADARVAAALTKAAEDVRQWGSLLCGSEDVTDEVASDILNLIPDAGAAFDRAIAEAEARGMERAAKLVEDMSGLAPDENDYDLCTAIAAAIRASAEGEG